MPDVRRVLRAGVALLSLTAAVHAPGAAMPPNPDIDPGTAVSAPAPDFELRDQTGRRRSLAQLRGKVVLLAFVDTRCTSICPLTSESMAEALRLLGPAALRVQLVGINANPLATSVTDVAAYTREHHMQGRWWFLTGSEPELVKVWRAYGVFIAAVHGEIDHQPLMVLIDGRGVEREIYYTQMSYGGLDQQAEVLAQGIARLLPGRVAVRQPLSLQYLAPSGLAASAHLQTFAGGRIVLTPAQPHLLLFFASWLGGARLSAELTALDRYAVLARRRGWPEPIAIDELPTEARTAAWRQRLSRWASALRLPVAADPRGRLADGYGVHDLPWLSLVASGRILWQHDGWIPPQSLAARVRAAWRGGVGRSAGGAATCSTARAGGCTAVGTLPAAGTIAGPKGRG